MQHPLAEKRHCGTSDLGSNRLQGEMQSQGFVDLEHDRRGNKPYSLT